MGFSWVAISWGQRHHHHRDHNHGGEVKKFLKQLPTWLKVIVSVVLAVLVVVVLLGALKLIFLLGNLGPLCVFLGVVVAMVAVVIYDNINK